MMGFNWPLARRLRTASPSLRPLLPRLSAAVQSGRLEVPPNGQTILLIDETGLHSGNPQQWNTNVTSILVLEGPTPSNAERVPASLVCLPLQKDGLSSAGDLITVARQLVVSLRLKETVEDTDFCDIWRTHGLSCSGAGEPVHLGTSGQVLEQLLLGKQGNQTGHPFWNAVLETCKTEELDHTAAINHLMSQNTLWFSPYGEKAISPEEATTTFKVMHHHWQTNDQPSHCFGAQYWNHPSIGATFSGRGGTVSFHETETEVVTEARKSSGRVLSWAGRTSVELEAACTENEIPLFRIEDGFLRSVGLGAGLARGAMLAVDDLGIYYDPSRASRLEVLLRDYELSSSEHRRGQKLIDLIRQSRISKYNFGRARSYTFPPERLKILVPGQVADDAAIRKSKSQTIDCANTPNVNLDLLRLARARNPEAFLIFKPHPDVETGLRKGKVSRDEALGFVDLIAEDANIIDLIESVDKVETFSSLSGFEALLRDKQVVVHGAPFYAGWGLCEDLTPLEGRGRCRSLSELVFLSLVKYARTIDPVTLLPCTPEFLISRLAEQRTDRKHLLITAAKRHASWLGRKLGL